MDGPVTAAACPITAAELAGIEDALAAVLTMQGEIRRPTAQPAPWIRVATVPCYLTLTSGATRETVTTPGHEDAVNAELLVPSGTDLRPNDAVLVNGGRFVVRMLDPDDVGVLRALGRVER